MCNRSSVRGRALAFVAAAVLMGSLPVMAAEEKAGPTAEGAVADEPTARDDCCFNNRSFSGVCVVTPEEDETCATILAYLNNPQSQGKNYCGKTTIRGGWQQTSCEASKSGGPVESPRR